MKTLNFKSSKFVNLIGLIVGITCVIAIMLWVEDELTFDTFHKDYNDIYRVLVEENGMNGYSNSAMTMPPVVKIIQDNIPEVVIATNYESNWNVVVKVNDNYLNEDGMAVIAPEFFDIFSFPVEKGDIKRLYTEKYSVALSQKTAKKYFGDEEPLGKSIDINKNPVTVIAVFDDVTNNSHINFDLLIPVSLCETMFGRGDKHDWGRQCLYTYIKVKPGVSQKQLDAKLHNILVNSPRKDMVLLSQPLKDIHFQKNLADEDYTTLGDKSYVFIFSFLGLFILILACVNYINLSTAAAEKEITNNGIRKLFGANKSGLIRTSLLKYIAISTIATLIALLIIVFLLLPLINKFTDKTLSFEPFTLNHVGFIVSVSLITGLLSGLYPAVSMASFSPLRVIKRMPHSSGALRQWLTVFQFAMSVFLIVATIVSFKQLSHIRNANIGFDKEQVLYFRLDHKENSYVSLKEKLGTIPQIEKVGGKLYYSPSIMNTISVKLPKHEKEDDLFVHNMIDEDFFPLLNVKMFDGQSFQEDSKSQWRSSVIINKKALDLFEGNPVGQTIRFSGKAYTVTGVIDETYFRSINSSQQPELYVYEPRPEYVFVKYIKGTNITQLNAQIASVVKDIYPEAPLDIQFLDTTYEKLYENDKRVSSLFSVLAVIAIIISSFGLFALSKFATEKRIKEIGIRKVNGAKISEILLMLNKGFIKWVAIAFVIAIPIAYFAMNKWLENFACKTSLSWWIFVLAGVLVMGIALFTVSWQSWRAATRNPVEALRYE
jgi:putative ABC transport system permease protein